MLDIVLSILIMLLALLIYKKEYIFLMGYTKRSKDTKKVKDKKKLSKDLSLNIFIMGLTFLITNVLNDLYFDGDLDVLLDFFVIVFLVPFWLISLKVGRGEY
ncbi:DUF3784 domain-containing protein [Senegalia massiliensis]|uniref:DUF3784 domain-containing protein n=1 Tax=Senegalia massiliensis TaxID=1720316 RepID=A0A845QZU1_9CLOT|nr:DUF3784 domain-containing protein [Senegalia massiliensis]NBI07259.1 DUF3784 domain-containing protein [Senegalia massiliensis]